MSDEKIFPEFNEKSIIKDNMLIAISENQMISGAQLKRLPVTIKEAERRGADRMLALMVSLYKEQGIMLCGDNEAIWAKWELLAVC